MNEPNEIFVATMHSSGGHANKDTGLQVAVSTDGVTFRNLRGSDESPIYTPTGGMRDPIVLYRQGEWYLASNGNFEKKVIWYADSADMGITWTSPKAVTFKGFDQEGVNWAQFVRITDPAAMAQMNRQTF